MTRPRDQRLWGVCNRSPAGFDWFKTHFPRVKQYTSDYRELLANGEIDAIYAEVPHHLHEEIYGATIRAGKHLMGEKPFGIDLAANSAILRSMGQGSFVRCSSQFPFFPAMQRMGGMIESNAFGRILEANTGFLHSSDLVPGSILQTTRFDVLVSGTSAANIETRWDLGY